MLTNVAFLGNARKSFRLLQNSNNSIFQLDELVFANSRYDIKNVLGK